MGIIRNATEGIYPYQPYQQALWDKISQGGFKQGQMTLYSSGRQTGKSMLNAIYDNNLCKEITLSGQEYLHLVELKMGFANLATDRIKQRKKVKQYKFSRAEWYVAEFDWVRQAEVLAWCRQQFGPHPNNPDAWSRWYNKYSEKIHFRDAKDYEWFVLRWS
jgi:hypothetical protein